jgi:hypothetical protein
MSVFKESRLYLGQAAITFSCLFIFHFIMALVLGFDFNTKAHNLTGWKDFCYYFYYWIISMPCSMILGFIFKEQFVRFIEKIFKL